MQVTSTVFDWDLLYPMNAEQTEKDWANLTEQDRQVSFSWLDEFFTHLLGVLVRPRQGSRLIHAVMLRLRLHLRMSYLI